MTTFGSRAPALQQPPPPLPTVDDDDAVDAVALSPSPLAGVDAAGLLRWANPAFSALCRRLPCGDGAVAGAAVAELLGLDAADSARWQAALAALAPGAGVELTLTRRAPGIAVESVDLKLRRARGGGALLTLPPAHTSDVRRCDEALAQLAMAVDLAHMAIWRHDLASDRICYSAQAHAVLDLAPRDDGMALHELRALIHPDDLAQVSASAQRALEGDRPTDMEARYRRRDGQWRTVLTRRVVQRDDEGRALAFIGVALDVTARLDESRRAVESNRRLELVTRTAGIGYWSVEGDEGAHWSDQLRAIHGLPAAQPVPTMRAWLETYPHADERAAVRARFADWLRSGRRDLQADFRMVRSDGQVRHVMTHSRVESTAPNPLLFGVVIDVTERRQAEAALREASERAALAARGVGLGTWELHLSDGLALWDEQMWRLRGLSPRARAPGAEEQMALVHPDDRTWLQRSMEHAMRTQTPANYEFRILLPDGRERWIASRSAAVRDEGGRAVRRIGVNWDVTDRRSAEAARHEREVAQREKQATSQFLARMSHELRTPLNAVLGFAQLLLAEGPEVDPRTRRRRVEHIESAGRHLLALIDDVLDLASLEGGQLRVALQPVALAPLVQATLPLLEPLRCQRHVEFDLGALDVVPLADATRLRQVLLNLLTNAVKYNREGGRVTLQAHARDGRVTLSVADTGRGMTALQLRHLFEPFNRLGIEREAIEGNGIGLTVVKALVERMGGSLKVDSEAGVGSCFELQLHDSSAPGVPTADATPPAPPAPLPAPAPAPAPADDAPPRATLLYVEDNPVNAQIVAELVARRPDLRLHIAEDGRSGVDKAQALRPDLVLLDMQLPDIDGHEVLRRLRAHADTASIPVIALSANAMPDDINRALQAGLSDYWTKPLDFRAFMSTLETLFGRP